LRSAKTFFATATADSALAQQEQNARCVMISDISRGLTPSSSAN
jgi:hypothetical protein